MPLYQINGYDVDFPHEAYPCQLAYMEKVLAALDQSENALLESPTGTGKTLCLLCATLAWRQAFMKRNAAAAASDNPEAAANALTVYDYKQQQAGIGAPRDPAAAQHRGPTIIYTSRTHSQLAQVTKELRNTTYKVRTTVLGSRNQLCLNEKVLKLPGQAGNFTCRALVQHKQCRWHMKHRQDKVTQELSSSATPPAPIDIEELNKVGKHAEVCPYFLSRDLAGTADIIFMPYNYLVDASSRSQLSNINWTNAVIIVDEAHNIQDACNSNASFDLTTDQILGAISEMERAQEVVKDNISSGRASEGMLMLQQQHNPAAAAAAVSGGDQAELLDRLDCGVKILSALYQKIMEMAEGIGQGRPGGSNGISGGGFGRGGGSSGGSDSEGIAQKGEGLLAMLAELDITQESYSQYLQALLMDAVGVLTEHELASGRSMAAKAGVVAGGLSALLSALDIVFASTAPLWVDNIRGQHGPPAHRGYRMYLHKTESKQGGKKSNAVVPAGPSFTLSYWCFIPGVSMAALREMPLRSVLLTSGTLSPLESFAHELQLGFKYSLENPHVITPNQVWVGVVPAGPTGAKLNSSFANRSSDKYRDDLGNAIANFARVVPDGLLVFFPAYSLLTACLDHWKTSTGTAGGATVWERITRHKAPVIEPRDSGAFAAALADYAAKLEDPNGTGAVLFAVCRGKVSEGIDFSDKAGRGVVITGLPFPAAYDPHVKLQRQLLDEEARAGARGVCGGKGLTGEQWYVQQGLRAVNQAMGRVIRHRWDYGAVLLADERFGSQQNLRNMSKWLRDQLVQHNSFGGAIASLTRFFKDKGDLTAAAAAAMANRPAAAGAGQQSAPSAFQLLGGSSIGRAAAAARAAAERQQRQQQLASVPRAIDVLGIVTHTQQQQQTGLDSQGEDAFPASQLDGIISGIQPAAAAARSALLAANKQPPTGPGGSGGAAAAGGSSRGLPPRRCGSGGGGGTRFARGGLVQLQFEADSTGPGQQQAGAAAADDAGADAGGCDVVGPAHLVQQHKLRQQQGQLGPPPQGQQQQQQQQQQKAGGKQPLRMGQFLRSWNSTQQEELKQQQDQQPQQQQAQREQLPPPKQQQQQQQLKQQQQQQPGVGPPPLGQQQKAASQQQQTVPNGWRQSACAAASLPTDAKSFFQLLQAQLPPQQMAAVKELLTTYRAKRDLALFADGLIGALGGSGGSNGGSSGSSYRHLLSGFATFMPSKDQQWFRTLVASGVAIKDTSGHKRPSSSGVDAAAAAASGGKAAAAGAAAAAGGAGRAKGAAGSADGQGGSSGSSHPAKKQKVGSSGSRAAAAAGQAGGAGKVQQRPLGLADQKQQQQQPQQAEPKQQGLQQPGRDKQQQQQKASKLAPPGQPPAGGGTRPGHLPPASAAAAGGGGGSGSSSGSSRAAGRLPPASAPAKPCSKCKKAPMASAHKAACGHLACYSCWLDLLATNLRGVGCPACGKLVRKAQLAAVPFA